ncbi:sensor histidine kinase [Pyxidicoccus xibeiensis]|uniref:sensor histidine kinase n=1 Tax=Pyxidicoccus xibeiensis TaxID=2906759 RepID=UPI0020A794CA|nr:HAMP domain-containing sensor histidine kinase [Pyxidicoccus xibeiensis]MCP3144261.1 HAMP domain-containing histidine kinase [Pyxidicoccus xibeiensis]
MKQLRLRQFLTWMLPVAVGFLLVYTALAVVLRSVAFAGGAVAVLVYAVALAWARRLAGNGQSARASSVSGHALLVMIALGAPFLGFLYAALMMIPIAGVALVLPYLERPALARYMVAAFVVDVWVLVVGGLLPPLVEQPPLLLQRGVLFLAVVACVGLTLRMLWVDSARLRLSLALAEEALAARDEFLAVASHELRTPLTPLGLKLQALRRELTAQPAPERGLAHLDVAQRQVKKLVELVDDLLDVSRISAGRMELSPARVDFSSLVREAVTRFEPEAARVRCPLALDVPGAMPGRVDPRRFEQVLDNLLSNALKYGAGKPISVRLEQRGTHARLTVRDEGIGIPAESLERIFNRFERAVSSRHFSGLGMGLYIVRRIVEASGGTVAAASTPGLGATFTVELPLGGELDVAAEAESAPASAVARPLR